MLELLQHWGDRRRRRRRRDQVVVAGVMGRTATHVTEHHVCVVGGAAAHVAQCHDVGVLRWAASHHACVGGAAARGDGVSVLRGATSGIVTHGGGSPGAALGHDEIAGRGGHGAAHLSSNAGVVRGRGCVHC